MPIVPSHHAGGVSTHKRKRTASPHASGERDGTASNAPVLPVPGLPADGSLVDLFGDGDLEIFDMDSDFDHMMYDGPGAETVGPGEEGNHGSGGVPVRGRRQQEEQQQRQAQAQEEAVLFDLTEGELFGHAVSGPLEALPAPPPPELASRPLEHKPCCPKAPAGLARAGGESVVVIPPAIARTTSVSTEGGSSEPQSPSLPQQQQQQPRTALVVPQVASPKRALALPQGPADVLMELFRDGVRFGLGRNREGQEALGGLRPYSATCREALRRIDHLGILPLEVLAELPAEPPIRAGGQTVMECRDYRPLPARDRPPGDLVSILPTIGSAVRVYRAFLSVPATAAPLSQDVGLGPPLSQAQARAAVAVGAAGISKTKQGRPPKGAAAAAGLTGQLGGGKKGSASKAVRAAAAAALGKGGVGLTMTASGAVEERDSAHAAALAMEQAMLRHAIPAPQLGSQPHVLLHGPPGMWTPPTPLQERPRAQPFMPTPAPVASRVGPHLYRQVGAVGSHHPVAHNCAAGLEPLPMDERGRKQEGADEEDDFDFELMIDWADLRDLFLESEYGVPPPMLLPRSSASAAVVAQQARPLESLASSSQGKAPEDALLLQLHQPLALKPGASMPPPPPGPPTPSTGKGKRQRSPKQPKGPKAAAVAAAAAAAGGAAAGGVGQAGWEQGVVVGSLLPADGSASSLDTAGASIAMLGGGGKGGGKGGRYAQGIVGRTKSAMEAFISSVLPGFKRSGSASNAASVGGSAGQPGARRDPQVMAAAMCRAQQQLREQTEASFRQIRESGERVGRQPLSYHQQMRKVMGVAQNLGPARSPSELVERRRQQELLIMAKKQQQEAFGLGVGDPAASGLDCMGMGVPTGARPAGGTEAGSATPFATPAGPGLTFMGYIAAGTAPERGEQGAPTAPAAAAASVVATSGSKPGEPTLVAKPQSQRAIQPVQPVQPARVRVVQKAKEQDPPEPPPQGSQSQAPARLRQAPPPLRPLSLQSHGQQQLTAQHFQQLQRRQQLMQQQQQQHQQPRPQHQHQQPRPQHHHQQQRQHVMHSHSALAHESATMGQANPPPRSLPPQLRPQLHGPAARAPPRAFGGSGALLPQSQPVAAAVPIGGGMRNMPPQQMAFTRPLPGQGQHVYAAQPMMPLPPQAATALHPGTTYMLQQSPLPAQAQQYLPPGMVYGANPSLLPPPPPRPEMTAHVRHPLPQQGGAVPPPPQGPPHSYPRGPCPQR